MKLGTIVGVLALAVSVGSATAQSNFEGLYGGLTASGQVMADDGRAYQAGAVAGYRFGLADLAVLGLEAGLSVGDAEARYITTELAVDAHLGVPMGDLMPFVSAGATGRSFSDYRATWGSKPTETHWTAGGGVELAINPLIHIRGHAQYLGPIAPDAAVGGVRVSLGVLGQFN
jgi:hypothetical protein